MQEPAAKHKTGLVSPNWLPRFKAKLKSGTSGDRHKHSNMREAEPDGSQTVDAPAQSVLPDVFEKEG